MATPTRAEFDRLHEEFDVLRRRMDALAETSRQQQMELAVQFKRIAEMQALLDRRVNVSGHQFGGPERRFDQHK
jgi:hypothetical protein